MADFVGLITLTFLVLNVIAFIIYGVDKIKAQNDAWRISESTLLTIAAIAPWGALIGMHIFRHKTRKPKFKLIWVFAAIHLIIAVLIMAMVQ